MPTEASASRNSRSIAGVAVPGSMPPINTEILSGPSISIVIPTFNRAQMVVRAVDSVIAAARSDDEIIVVDDGSTDDTLERLRPYEDRIIVVKGAHAGAGAARNLGVSLAKKRWIGFLDSDDTWDSDKLLLQRALLEEANDIAFIFTDFRVRMSDGSVVSNYIKNWSRDTRSWEEILGPCRSYSELALLPPGRADFKIYKADLYKDLMARSYLATFTYLFRKDLGEPLPTFAEDVPTLEDWQFFAQVAQKGRGLYMDCETATQDGHSGPRLTDSSELDMINSRLTVMHRIWACDSAFMQVHQSEYCKVRSGLEQRRNFLWARKLVLAGQLEDARSVFAGAGMVPWKYRLLFRFPNLVVHGVIWLMNLLGGSNLIC